MGRASCYDRVVKRLRGIVPARFVQDSDFKCSSPGEDEAALLAEYAAWAGLTVETAFVQWDESRMTRVHVTRDGVSATLRFVHVKYYFPPVAVLSYLNRELERMSEPSRFVALAGEGRELVALVTPPQLAAISGLGYEVVFEGVDASVFAHDP